MVKIKKIKRLVFGANPIENFTKILLKLLIAS